MDEEKVVVKDNPPEKDMENEMNKETWKPKAGKAGKKATAEDGAKCDKALCVVVPPGAKAKRDWFDSRGNVLDLLEERALNISATSSETEEDICYPILTEFMSTMTDEQWMVIRQCMRKPGSKAKISRMFQRIVRIISETAFQLLIPAILQVIEQQQQLEESGSASQERESAGPGPTREELIRELNYLKREVRKPGSGIHYYSRPASKASSKSSQDPVQKFQKVPVKDTMKTFFGVTKDSILNSLEAAPVSGSPELTRAIVGEVLNQLNAGMSVVMAHSPSSGRSSPMTGCCQMVCNTIKRLTKMVNTGLQMFKPVQKAETPPLVQEEDLKSFLAPMSEEVMAAITNAMQSVKGSGQDVVSLSLAETQSAASLITEVTPVWSEQVSPVWSGQVSPVPTASLTEFMDYLFSQQEEMTSSSDSTTSYGASTCTSPEERTSDVTVSPFSLLATPFVSAPPSPSPTLSLSSTSQTTTERETLKTPMQSSVQFQFQPTVAVGEVLQKSSAEFDSLVSCLSSQHSLHIPTESEFSSRPSSSKKKNLLDELVFSLPGTPTPNVVSIDSCPIVRNTVVDMTDAPKTTVSVSGTTQILSGVASIVMDHLDAVGLHQSTSPGSEPATALGRLGNLLAHGSLCKLSRDLVDRLQSLMSEQEYDLYPETVPAGKSVSDTFLSRCKTKGVQLRKLFTSELVYCFAEESVNRWLVSLLLPPPSVDRGASQDKTSPHVSTQRSLTKNSSVGSDTSLCVFNDTVSLLSKVLTHQVMDTLSLTFEPRMELNLTTPQPEATGRQNSSNSFPSLPFAGTSGVLSIAGQEIGKDCSALTAGGLCLDKKSRVGMRKRFQSLFGLGKPQFKCKTDQNKDAKSPQLEKDQASKSYEQEQCVSAHICFQQSDKECVTSTSQTEQGPAKHSLLTCMLSAISTGVCMPFRKTKNQ